MATLDTTTGEFSVSRRKSEGSGVDFHFTPAVPEHRWFQIFGGKPVALYRIPDDGRVLHLQVGSQSIALDSGVTSEFSPVPDDNWPPVFGGLRKKRICLRKGT